MRRTAGKRVLAGLAVLGIVLISGLLAAWGVTPGARRAISAADVVSLRFPADWNDEDRAGAAPTATFALASVSETRPYDNAILFNPNPTWTTPAAEPVPQAIAPVEPKAEPKFASKFESRSEPGSEIKAAPRAEAKPVVAAAHVHAAAHHAASHPRRENAVLFNEAQLASIKARLKLSDYQQQYWPAVAAALRALGERAAHAAPVRTASAYASEGPLAAIDPDGPEVQQLKSAAFPLIMSMNDEQKNQVRTLAHVMGLEQVATAF